MRLSNLDQYGSVGLQPHLNEVALYVAQCCNIGHPKVGLKLSIDVLRINSLKRFSFRICMFEGNCALCASYRGAAKRQQPTREFHAVGRTDNVYRIAFDALDFMVGVNGMG